ncbi:sensor histidine kinase [Actinomadura sp. WMMB 499]|uniref:sensor histidine kinase n=1 Tax=Actinomadura sp. WMMB 499 TaxID=1219491 RepID=UPI0012488CB6|nr:sensor histidine kinase [Actinomadura sp. WMMB 499]QFG19998.1 sensor histidine kinase [Actinomadura sp. WMMB 499]
MGARRRLRPRHGRLTDEALAAAVSVVVVVGSLRSVIGSREEPWAQTALGWALIVVVCGSLFVRRLPLAAAVVSVVATGVYYVFSTYDGPLMIAPILAVYLLASKGRLQAASGIAALIVIGTALGTLSGNGDVNGVALFMLAGWVVAMVALGWVRHSRRAFLAEAERRAAGDERLRIARELHDVTGHHISLINVQAGTALHRFHRDPAQAEAALAAIKETSREALRELRATLGVLRQADEDVPTSPVPGLDRIGELAGPARAAGLDVRTRIDGADGTGAPVPTEVGLAAYRIVQESLTNVVRHAGAANVTVRVERGAREVLVEVADDGRGAAPGEDGAPAVPGNGILGMRERARALGGDLTTGPGPDGGHLVRARLPYRNGDHR